MRVMVAMDSSMTSAEFKFETQFFLSQFVDIVINLWVCHI